MTEGDDRVDASLAVQLAWPEGHDTVDEPAPTDARPTGPPPEPPGPLPDVARAFAQLEALSATLDHLARVQARQVEHLEELVRRSAVDGPSSDAPVPPVVLESAERAGAAADAMLASAETTRAVLANHEQLLAQRLEWFAAQSAEQVLEIAAALRDELQAAVRPLAADVRSLKKQLVAAIESPKPPPPPPPKAPRAAAAAKKAPRAAAKKAMPARKATEPPKPTPTARRRRSAT